ncbi:selenide, water dikinase SelD [Larkinella terrae]|uniref:Selenide, water dikinase n=1 Tax=Larkinella terrae TaxID=2025311 RepID=A0A7K0EIH8_9BACT|nr:selenide, water dikinase SelD [Larkinella terrae]MRS61555.1 selenide, water dikinase SelD [Larkinella terrae]
MIQQTEIYKLAQFSHSAGFAGKLAPEVLNALIGSPGSLLPGFPHLLVDLTNRDDAAVLETGHGEAVVSTADFFAPFVDDAFEFGRIASSNAVNNIYAMGGEPLLAIALLGWPSANVPTEEVGQILDGSRALCAEAGIPLAGVHTLESAEPFFGLAVTGKVRLNHLKQISTATEGCCLYLTKPLGTGPLLRAQQKETLNPEHADLVRELTTRLNSFGTFLGKLPYVKALTHVSGYGLLGHLIAMTESSGVSAEIDFHKIPVLPVLDAYLNPENVPDATHRNWDYFGDKTNELTEAQRFILADPQLSGGLLIAVDPGSSAEFERVAFENKLYLKAFGQLTEKRKKAVYVR